jgi:hypothetical protein
MLFVLRRCGMKKSLRLLVVACAVVAALVALSAGAASNSWNGGVQVAGNPWEGGPSQ